MLNYRGRAVSWTDNLEYNDYEDYPELEHVYCLVHYFTKSDVISTVVKKYFQLNKTSKARHILIKNDNYIREFKFDVTLDSIADLQPGIYCTVEGTVFETKEVSIHEDVVLVGKYILDELYGNAYIYNCSGVLARPNFHPGNYYSRLFMNNSQFMLLGFKTIHAENSLLIVKNCSRIEANNSVIVCDYPNEELILENSVGINMNKYSFAGNWINIEKPSIVNLSGEKAVIETTDNYVYFQNAIVITGNKKCRKVKFYRVYELDEIVCEYTNLIVGYCVLDLEIEEPFIYHNDMLYLRDRTYIKMDYNFRQVPTLSPPVINGIQTRFGIPWTDTYEEDMVTTVLPHYLPGVLVNIVIEYIYIAVNTPL